MSGTELWSGTSVTVNYSHNIISLYFLVIQNTFVNPLLYVVCLRSTIYVFVSLSYQVHFFETRLFRLSDNRSSSYYYLSTLYKKYNNAKLPFNADYAGTLKLN